MILGARTGAWAQSVGGGEWKNPYITDGLVAMWDGEWNVGGGIHDPNATEWIDIVDGHVLNVTSGHFGDKSLIAANSTTLHVAESVEPVQWLSNAVNQGGGFTFEICANQMSLAQSFANFNIVISNTQGQYIIVLPSGYGYPQYNWGYKGYGILTGFYVGCGVAEGITASFTLGPDQRNNYRNGVISNSVSASVGTYNFTNTMIARGSGDTFCIRFYNRALTPEEISANYAVDKARFNLA